ncbi:MAG: hypothetical protein DCC65_17945 [Planctomycetota bacterium]|nr:MAG: hypothetical protein DCC65_17945 [Planctomycetota bacterium]
MYTAFGERVWSDGSIGATRYQYAGAWGYQTFPEHTGQPGDEIPFIHVGHRWYDPATGRFLQRDPIGIRGGINLYAYAGAHPSSAVDPSGLAFVLHWRERGLNPGHTAVMSDYGVYISFVPSCGAVGLLGCASYSNRSFKDDIDAYGFPDQIVYISGLNEAAVGNCCSTWDGTQWTPQRNCIDSVFDCLGAGGGYVPNKPGPIWLPSSARDVIKDYPGRRH